MEVRLEGGAVIVLDAGTGIRALGLQLQPEALPEVHILLSHLHLDHLVGLGFFSPLYRKETTVHLWGPRSPLDTLEERVTRYLSPPLFPVRLHDIPSQLVLHDVPEDPWEIAGALVTADHVTHQGPTLGFRIENAGRSLAYIPDHEPGLGIDISRIELDWLSGHRVAVEADVLLHDSQYTAKEYGQRIGWGHSSIEQAVAFARRSEVGRLVLFHHDPLHSDIELEVMQKQARALWGGDSPVLAHEGMTIELTASRPVFVA